MVKMIAAPNSPSYKALAVRSLNIVQNGTIDLTNNGLIVDYLPTLAQWEKDIVTGAVRGWIVTARGGIGTTAGTWTGWGITSSTAAAYNVDHTDARSVGYAVNTELRLGAKTSFLGQAVDSSVILMRYTVTADNDLSGGVNDDDVTVLGTMYSATVQHPQWSYGDSNYDGFVNDDDVTLQGVYYGQLV